ncbi:glycosyltransferase family 39 protein, partial [candidate division WOR-3 bacterium]|nr:glycosyltransferase family 39 protein [candidate division WOR-3 bacterium]
MNKIKILDSLPKSTYLWWGGFSLVALLAAVLRFYHLAYESLWMDEIRQVSYYSKPIKGVISGAASQTQPPLDYLIGWGLHHLGLADSDWWVRFPAAIFGIGSILLLMWWCRRFINDFTALVAGTLVSICPLHIRMSQEARPYTIFIFLALLSLIYFSYAWTKNRRS